MEPDVWQRHRWINAMQSLLLLASMAAMLSALGYVVAGSVGVLWALGGGAALVAFNPGLSPGLVLRLYGARAVGPRAAPDLHHVLSVLAERAGLERPPALFHVPSRMLNAFAVGSRDSCAIAVTDGLLRTLAPREVIGVLAHEVSHVRHNDMWIMGLADLLSRLTSLFATAGQLLVLVNLPLMLLGTVAVSWWVVLVLVLAPLVTGLMQLALSRTREYDADLGAVALTGDPRGLASALARMERYQGRFVEQILFPGRRVPDPSLLRTHPPTEERVRRLLALESSPVPALEARGVDPRAGLAHPPVARRPRWHAHGIWY
ncbi:MAG: M48 family metalloprotease [Ectothiorhodospiraceae bacterium]|nr:M48 family metalloprotease [Ectothiorhodospiraceae bacterium]